MTTGVRAYCTVLTAVTLCAALVTAALSNSFDGLLPEPDKETEGRSTGRCVPMESSEWIPHWNSSGHCETLSCGSSLARPRSRPIPARVNRPASMFGRLYDHSPPAAAER